MTRALVDEILRGAGRSMVRVIIPCGPAAWYEPSTTLANTEYVSLAHVEVFHMGECLDWQGPTGSAQSAVARLGDHRTSSRFGEIESCLDRLQPEDPLTKVNPDHTTQPRP